METGSHELTVDGYSSTKGLGVGKCITSAKFNVGGHGWSIQYFPDGFTEESADWVSLFLHLDDTGDNVKVNAQYKFCLLDQMGEPVPSYTLTSMRRDFCPINSHTWGFTQFIERKKLEKSPHIEDDSFRICCHVTVFKIRSEETPVHFNAAPSTDLHRHLGDLLDSKVGADVKFKVGRETFMAHRSILAARSPVFKAELFGWMC